MDMPDVLGVANPGKPQPLLIHLVETLHVPKGLLHGAGRQPDP